MKENVENTLRMMVNEKASGKNCVWNKKVIVEYGNHNFLDRKGDSLVVPLYSTLPASMRKART